MARKKKQEPVANTVLDFVTDIVEQETPVETPVVIPPKSKQVKVNGDDYFLVKVTSIGGSSSSHPVPGWKLSSWLKFYESLNSVIEVDYELSSKEVYNIWMYSPVADDPEEPVLPKKKPRKKLGD